MPTVGFLVVSQLATVARGMVSLVQPLAPDVMLQPCACAAPSLAQSVSEIAAAAAQLTNQKKAPKHILVVADVGSSAVAVQEFLSEQDGRRFIRARGPYLEGLIAGAVAAHQGSDTAEVLRTVAAAAQFFDRDANSVVETEPEVIGPAEREVQIGLENGLDARPAATIARLVSDHQAAVLINGIDAGSVLGLMRAHLAQGQTVTVTVEGPDGQDTLEQVCAILVNA